MKKIKKEILLPFFQEKRELSFEKYIEERPNTSTVDNKNKAVELIFRGNVGIFLSQSIFLIDIRQVVNDKPGESTVENTIQGPQLALSENVATSLTQIRNPITLIH